MAHLITAIDKTYSIKSGEWHKLANIPRDDNGQPVPSLLAHHLTDIFHPIIALPDLASDGAPFEGTIPESALAEIQRTLATGDVMGAFLAARAALYPNRVTLPDWKGVAADMRHCGGNLVPLAVHGEGYKEIENAAFWNAKERALANIPHVVTTAGTLDGCKRFYICIELPDAAFSAAGESFREYLCIVTSHDGTMAAQAFISRTRIVCNNTFTAAEAGTQCRFRLKHTAGVDVQLPGLDKFISDAHAGRAKFCEAYQMAKETPVKAEKAMALITGYVYRKVTGRKVDTTGKAGNDRLSTRARNQIDEIFQAFQHGKGNDGKNLADLLNGFTEHYTSGSGTGLTRGGKEMTALEKHSVSEWGSAADVKREMVQIILDADGKEMQELVTLGETKGLDAYLEGTGKSRPVYLSGLERTRQTGTGYVERAAPVAPPVVSTFASLLDMPLSR